METLQETELMSPETRIINAYKDYILNNGKRPASVYKFAADLGLSEQEFYSHFGSFVSIERKIWEAFVTDTVSRLEADQPYQGFSSREKILAFYYAFFEELKKSRSFALLQLENQKKFDLTPGYLKDFKTAFQKYISGVVDEGKTNGEIARRPYVDKKYPSVFWLHMGFVLLFWRDDNSADFEKTDAAIEKSVNLAFDLIGKGAVDTVVDFAKFLYQSRGK